MKLRHLYALATLALSGTATAQNWVRTVDEHLDINEACVRPNGDTIVLGTTNDTGRLEVFSSTGQDKGALHVVSPAGLNLSASDVLARPDGDLLVAGVHDASPWIAAIDPDTGAMLWERNVLVQPAMGLFVKVEEQHDQIVACGYMFDATSYNDGLLVSCDPQGNLRWQRRIGPFDEHSQVAAAMPTSDGGVLAWVAVVSTVPVQSHLVKLDSSGSYQWSLDLGFPGATYANLELLEDGNVLALTDTFFGGQNNVWMAKITESGSILWQRTLAGFSHRRATPLPGGGAALTTILGPYVGVYKIDSDGNGVWHRKLPNGTLNIYMAGVGANPDGSVMVAWTVPDFTLRQNYIARIDSNASIAADCASAVFDLGIGNTAAGYSPSPSQLPVNLWFGTPTGLSTQVVGGTLVAQDFCGDPCGTPTSFCETRPNSVGSGARIGASGSVSVSANDLTLVTTGIAPNKKGIYFYGKTPTQVPFGQGLLCVQGTKYRLPLTASDESGTLTYALDLTQASNPNAVITPGSTWYFQCWYRDPAGGGNGVNLSDGLSTSWCP